MKREGMSKLIILITLIAALAIVVPLISSCLPPPIEPPPIDITPVDLEPEPEPLEPIILGHATYVTGVLAMDGRAHIQAAQMVLDELNAAGGILGRPVEQVIVDVGNNTPSELASARDLLKAADVDVVFDLWHLNPVAVNYMVEVDTFVVHMGWVSADWRVWNEIRDEYPYYVTMNEGEAGYGWPFFKALNNPEMVPWEFPNNKLAIMFSDWDYAFRQSSGFRDAALEDGWEIVLFEPHPINHVEFGTQMMTIREEEPALIYFSSIFPPEMIAAFTAFLEEPTTSLFTFSWGLEKPEFREAFGDLANGVMGTLPAFMFHASEYTGDNPNYKIHYEKGTYIKEFLVEKYGEVPNVVAPIMHDQIHAWAEAVERAGDVDDYDAILEEMLSGTYIGATGTYGFDRGLQAGYYGVDNIPLDYYQIQGGKLFNVAVGSGLDVEYIDDFIVPWWIEE